MLPLAAFADQSSGDDAATAQARQDYHTYIEEMKKLGEQYKTVTGEMKKVLQEEGYPTWDENSDSLKMVKPGTPLDEGTTPLQGQGYKINADNSTMTVIVELPGVKKDTFKVSLSNDKLLHITGHSKVDNSDIDRQIDLPYAAKDKNLHASYEDGILTVTLPRAEEANKEVTIPVQ